MFSLERTLHWLISREEFPACTTTGGDNILEDTAWMTCNVRRGRKRVYSMNTASVQHPQHGLDEERRDNKQQRGKSCTWPPQRHTQTAQVEPPDKDAARTEPKGFKNRQHPPSRSLSPTEKSTALTPDWTLPSAVTQLKSFSSVFN